MGLLDDLSTGWLVLVVLATMYAIAAAIYLCVMALATGSRAVAFKAISPGLLPPMGLLFGLLVGFLVAQVWNDSARAGQAVDREASALRSVDLLADAFPAETDARMRALSPGPHRRPGSAVQRRRPGPSRRASAGRARRLLSGGRRAHARFVTAKSDVRRPSQTAATIPRELERVRFARLRLPYPFVSW